MDRARELAELARPDWTAHRAPLVADTGWGDGPEPDGTRVLVFQAGGMVVVLEVTIRDGLVRVEGLVRPIPRPGVSVRLRRGGGRAVRCDRDGRFVLSSIDRGPVSLVLEVMGPPPMRIVTGWVTIAAQPADGDGEVSQTDTQGP